MEIYLDILNWPDGKRKKKKDNARLTIQIVQDTRKPGN